MRRFEDWIYAPEGWGIRLERFLAEVEVMIGDMPPEHVMNHMEPWLRAAWEDGFKRGQGLV